MERVNIKVDHSLPVTRASRETGAHETSWYALRNKISSCYILKIIKNRMHYLVALLTSTTFEITFS
jgi:hypothetical protein